MYLTKLLKRNKERTLKGQIIFSTHCIWTDGYLQNKFRVNRPSFLLICTYQSHVTSWRTMAEPDFEDFFRLPLLLCGLGCHRNPYQLQGTPKSVALECISQISLWGCPLPRRHTQWLTTDSLHGIKMRFPAWTNRTTCRKLPHKWGQHRARHWVPMGYCSFVDS